MMIALACDHGGFGLMSAVKGYLDSGGFSFKDYGTDSAESCDYPLIAHNAALAVASGECCLGIFICGTGIGMAMAANKTPGVRAALCSDCYTAEMARRHNNANVLALGARVTGEGLAFRIIDLFLRTGFDGGRHSRRVEMLNELDSQSAP